MPWPWSELGLPGPAAAEEIRHAYAQRLKEVHPEEDPEGFQRLHRAYQVARRLARISARPAAPRIEQEESGNDNTEPLETPNPDAAALETTAPRESPREEVSSEDGGEVPPDSWSENWDFESLLAQGVKETEPEDTPQEEEASAWVPPVYGKPKRRRWRDLTAERQINIIFIILLAVLLVLAIAQGLPGRLFSQSPAARAEETQAWLEKTFQVKLVSDDRNQNRDDRFLYWRADDPQIRFQAIWDEEGDFSTNYPNAMLFREMNVFAQAWPDYPLWFDTAMADNVGAGAEGGSPPVLFLFQVPLEGAEGFLEALGDQLEQLTQTDWYIRQPPEYILALAHGKAILQSYDSTAGEIPSSEELLTLYRENLCGYLLEDLLFQQGVTLWDFPDDDNLIWAKTGPGSVLDAAGYWITCYGTGRDGGILTMYYFLREDYTALYCIPDEWMDQEFTLSCIETRTMSCGRQIEIYRVL